MIAHDLAADWDWMVTSLGFSIGDTPAPTPRRKRIVWETAEYPPRGHNVRISRIVPFTIHGHLKVRAQVRYINPDTVVHLIPKENPQ